MSTVQKLRRITMSILRISSSARLQGSTTRELGHYLVNTLGQQAAGQQIVHRDLAMQPLASVSAEDLIGVHGSSDANHASLQQALAQSNLLIDELKAADTLILEAPMYNFGIAANLKHWIDAICRAGVSFRYTEQGPVGLLGIKRAFIITGSGGTPIGGAMDFASGYLEHICHFIGIEEVHHIAASGSKGAPEVLIQEGKARIDALLSTGAEAVA
jgi:FMN-dependent NADH-azoreductase